MPTKRRPISRTFQAPISDTQIELFLTGEMPEKADRCDWFDVLMKQDDELEADWQSVRGELLEEWIRKNPGTRPAAWWTYDSPRWREADMPERARGITCQTFCEPRKRLSGIGTPNYEVLNIWPLFAFGIPTGWVTVFDQEYYNGKRRDIHGNRIGTEYRDGHFKGLAPRPDDPPVFESQASYLDRHGLLTEAERRRLPDDAFTPERIEVPIEDAPDLRATHPDTWAKPCFDQTKEGSH